MRRKIRRSGSATPGTAAREADGGSRPSGVDVARDWDTGVNDSWATGRVRGQPKKGRLLPRSALELEPLRRDPRP